MSRKIKGCNDRHFIMTRKELGNTLSIYSTIDVLFVFEEIRVFVNVSNLGRLLEEFCVKMFGIEIKVLFGVGRV